MSVRKTFFAVAEARPGPALETCRTVEEAAAALMRIPVAMAQNVTVLDRTGGFATVFVGADRAPAARVQAVCTNHQEDAAAWPEHAARSRTLERHRCLGDRLADGAMTLDALTAGMLEPPLYEVDAASGYATVYSAVYRPAEGAVDYVWPGRRWPQSFERFEPGSYTHRYAIPAGRPADQSPEARSNSAIASA
jgi:predicted choloylglycine hydrolase